MNLDFRIAHNYIRHTYGKNQYASGINQYRDTVIITHVNIKNGYTNTIVIDVKELTRYDEISKRKKKIKKLINKM